MVLSRIEFTFNNDQALFANPRPLGIGEFNFSAVRSCCQIHKLLISIWSLKKISQSNDLYILPIKNRGRQNHGHISKNLNAILSLTYEGLKRLFFTRRQRL